MLGQQDSTLPIVLPRWQLPALFCCSLQIAGCTGIAMAITSATATNTELSLSFTARCSQSLQEAAVAKLTAVCDLHHTLIILSPVRGTAVPTELQLSPVIGDPEAGTIPLPRPNRMVRMAVGTRARQ